MNYELISPTAGMIAYVRGLDAPKGSLRTTLAHTSHAEAATKGLYDHNGFAVDLSRMEKLRPWIKLRDEALIALLKLRGSTRILELAAGFSPVGAETVANDKTQTIRYLETDLPEVVARKRFAVMKAKPGALSRLRFAEANALESERLAHVSQMHLGGRPDAIVHQGLLQYLSLDEKRRVVTSIAHVLKTEGGVWITSDVVLKEHFLASFNRSAYTKRMHEAMTARLGRDMADCAFESYDEARALFREGGFSVTEHSQLELVEQVADIATRDWPERPNLIHQTIWEMRLG